MYSSEVLLDLMGRNGRFSRLGEGGGVVVSRRGSALGRAHGGFASWGHKVFSVSKFASVPQDPA